MRRNLLETSNLKAHTFLTEQVQPSGAPTSRLESLDFQLPSDLEANEPPEARGLSRDQVKLMVSNAANDDIVHSQFHRLGAFLEPGDLLVLNTSGTRNSALNVKRVDGTEIELHLSTHLPNGFWIVELRSPYTKGAQPIYDSYPGERLALPGGAFAKILSPYSLTKINTEKTHQRLWLANVKINRSVDQYLEKYGFPIRYKYVRNTWPNEYYQTVYATEKGSAEMPSAGRAFSAEMITRLIAKGIQFAPLILHTGVASQEDHEPPYEEYYRVPIETARLINATHKNEKRVIAVGTTVVRALETVTQQNRETCPSEGWTKLVITPERGVYSVDGLLTGFHEPKSTHLAMLGALATKQHLCLTYNEALKHHYLWHEFGDLHLVLKGQC